jgi:CubicO group peptidase (beta-lactamase class C family)
MRSPLKKKEYRYSDLGFYFFPSLVEQVTNQPFDVFLEQQFYQPLGLRNTFFQPLNRLPKDRIVPTEMDKEFRGQLIHGDVHDQGAALLGGISGHAGLFSNAMEVALIMQMLLDNGMSDSLRLLEEKTIAQFTKVRYPKNNNRRGLCFDKIPLKSTDKNRMPAMKASPASFGHSGFTGTFAWADPENKLVFVFLSNRIHPDSKNSTISRLSVRTKIHEVLYEAVK